MRLPEAQSRLREQQLPGACSPHGGGLEDWRTRGQVKPCRHIPSLCWDVAEVMFTHIALAKTNLMAKRSIHRAGLTLGSCWGREEEIFVG